MERKKVLDEIKFDDGKIFTSLSKAARHLLEYEEKLGREGWTGVHLKLKQHYDYAEVVMLGMRLENDAELNKRKKKEKKTDIVDLMLDAVLDRLKKKRS
jgi:hypothetical protein